MQETQMTDLLADMYTAKISAEVQPIGSYHAFGEGADRDFILLVKDQNDAALDLEDVGYVLCSANTYGGDFVSMRKGIVNVLVTDSARYFERGRIAFGVVCALGLRNKADRIAVHELLREVG